ncbi:MAG: hypothetical protein GKS00_01565 [Alphaproteobacteria bacterium]|nr:hypothetical protein [Alphaproteobacteria bacterium]
MSKHSMVGKSKIMRAVAASAFAVTLLSAPFISTAQAGSDGHRGHKHGYEVKKQKHWGHDRGRHHYGHKHYRKKHARKHRRLHRQHAHRYDHHRGHKRVRKVVHVHKYPRHERRYERHQRELIGSIVEALLRGQAGHYR